VALGYAYLELVFEAPNQIFLGEGRVVLFLLPQPGSTFLCHLVQVAVAMVNQPLPGATTLAVAAAQLG
jgi:hypothetical protein